MYPLHVVAQLVQVLDVAVADLADDEGGLGRRAAGGAGQWGQRGRGLHRRTGQRGDTDGRLVLQTLGATLYSAQRVCLDSGLSTLQNNDLHKLGHWHSLLYNLTLLQQISNSTRMHELSLVIENYAYDS